MSDTFVTVQNSIGLLRFPYIMFQVVRAWNGDAYFILWTKMQMHKRLSWWWHHDKIALYCEHLNPYNLKYN